MNRRGRTRDQLRTVIFTRQIGHYHDARFRAAAEALENLTVISTANESDFSELLARDLGNYPVEPLFADKEAYRDAVTEGTLVGTVGETLDKLRAQVVVVAGWAGAESFAAIRWARIQRVPIVIMSESQEFDADRTRLREAMKRHIVSMCDAALVGGPTHRDYIAALGIPLERIHLGYNAVDNDHFASGAALALLNSNALRAAHCLPERYILASGRFIPKKNFPALVQAHAAAIREVGYGPDLVILGDGETKGAIQDAIRQSGMEGRVHLPGFRDYGALPVYYALAEAFAHVSLTEQWGLVVNEAMAASLPVIVSQPCGSAQTMISDGINGLIINPLSLPDMTAALVRVFKMPPDQRAEMCRAARATVEQWGPERFSEGLKRAVDDACSLPPRVPLRFWDKMLLGRIARREIESVA